MRALGVKRLREGPEEHCNRRFDARCAVRQGSESFLIKYKVFDLYSY